MISWFEFEFASMGYVDYASLDLGRFCYCKFFFHGSNYLCRLIILRGSQYYLCWSSFICDVNYFT